MITVDPERDSLKKLGQYVKAFDSHFYGARGNTKMLQQVTQDLGIAYAKIAQSGTTDSQHYDIEHTGTIMLCNPEGKLMAFFTMPHQASLIAKDYLLLVS